MEVQGKGEMTRDQGTVHGEAIFNLHQTLDQQIHPLYHHHHHHHHHSNPQPRGSSNPDADYPDLVLGQRSKEAYASNQRQRSPATSTRAIISTVPLIRYRECLKNYAASMGSHVVDGCGEFMPSGEDGTPEALKCAACDCHRNFHRKEIDHHHHQQQQLHPPFDYHHHRISYTNPEIAPMMMTFGGGGDGGSGGVDDSSSEDLNMFHSSAGGKQKKKRFRTKFTQKQKEKMMEFAEKLGWRIQKQDDQQVHDFCTQVGVKRQVFKVWMHNNKHASKKKHDDQ